MITTTQNTFSFKCAILSINSDQKAKRKRGNEIRLFERNKYLVGSFSFGALLSMLNANKKTEMKRNHWSIMVINS